MERLSVTPQTTTTKTFENGTTVSAKILEKPKVIPGDTALHEATHTIAARRIVSATIIPSGMALGTTIPEKMTAAAAAAPAAMGHDGVGWDLFLTENYLGTDRETAKSMARAEIRGQEEEIHEVASLLEERRTIHQSDVEEGRENVKKRRDGIHEVRVDISALGEKPQSFKMESLRNEVTLDQSWVDLPKAA